MTDLGYLRVSSKEAKTSSSSLMENEERVGNTRRGDLVL